ncbi:MAG: peptidoglycan recognition protein family protein, partial [Candidatus Azambacteria bacterium]|nr:peptidoglycan recognition protein family protein [Candidatus Azambacteria bacterium]
MKQYLKILITVSIALAPGATLAQTYPGSDLPLILPRSAWENYQGFSAALNWVPEDKNADTFKDDNPNTNDAIPDYAPVERIVIHDTGCAETSARCNGNAFDSREIIQSIYRNHAQIRGWGDTGYHYFIDRNGIIYEGRYGGNGVRGAHVYNSKTCQNFNTGTIGIALLGNYAHTAVPAPAFASLTRLVGWLGATNNINVADTATATAIWSNPKAVSGSCDVSYGGFSTTFTGPVVVGHDDLEKGNPDPGTLDRTRLRTEAKTLENSFASYIYKAKDDTSVYAVTGGVLQKVSDTITTLSTNDQARVAEVNPNQLALFPEQNKTMLPDGTLAKARSRNDIYLIDGAKRHHITSAILFQRLGYSLAKVQIVSDRELLGYAKGDPIIFSNGTLLMSEQDKKVYLIKNGTRRHILSQRAFTQNKLNAKNIITIPQHELEAYPDSGVVGLPEGAIISLSSKATAPNYLIIDGGKRIIPSWDMFKRWGLRVNKITIISKADFNQYPDKGELPYPDGTLVRQEGRPEMYLVYKGKKY